MLEIIDLKIRRFVFSVASKSFFDLKCSLFGLVFFISFINCYGFDSELSKPPYQQPIQLWSRINYNAQLADPFFDSNEWSYPNYPYLGIERPINPPRLYHTAKCFSNSRQVRHVVDYCKAKFNNEESLDLFIHKDSPGFNDQLLIRVRKCQFKCQYWTYNNIGPDIPVTWVTTRQKLTLNSKIYRMNDVIKGMIDFECVEEKKNANDVEKYGKHQIIIRIFGVFKVRLIE